MSSISVRKLEHPTDTQIDEAVELCKQAYANDPTNEILTRGEPKLSDPAWRTVIRAGAHSGALYVASSDGSDAIQAVAVWFPPGTSLLGTPDQLALGFTEFIAAMSTEHREWFLNDYARKYGEFRLRSFGENTERDAWYCNLIATHPEYQGHGLASAILEEVAKVAADENKAVALCTQNTVNVPFYRKRGFTELGRSDDPLVYAFIRRPSGV
ncbi:hypothetical protein FA95DRAFT_1253590 [Auriscalpium vulgare]|uniref:Uncharacterized protein n=1 Tax=Auriscalpium vulgare TaxID=40419 RepID=A0ACB8S995_9AGAM|nr:hypothetical protein FA95DRAFT_1253590 [Auriscalpium vulgare]